MEWNGENLAACEHYESIATQDGGGPGRVQAAPHRTGAAARANL